MEYVQIDESWRYISCTFHYFILYSPATAWLVLSSDWSINLIGDFVFRPWRLLLLVTLLPGLIGGLILLIYPESPKLLLSLNKEEKALDAVDWISKFNRGIPLNRVLNSNEVSLKPEIQAEENVLANTSGCGMLANIGRATLPLFHKPHGYNFVLCNLAVFGMFFRYGIYRI